MQCHKMNSSCWGRKHGSCMKLACNFRSIWPPVLPDAAFFHSGGTKQICKDCKWSVGIKSLKLLKSSFKNHFIAKKFLIFWWESSFNSILTWRLSNSKSIKLSNISLQATFSFNLLPGLNLTLVLLFMNRYHLYMFSLYIQPFLHYYKNLLTLKAQACGAS